jgi:hypothetical protein
MTAFVSPAACARTTAELISRCTLGECGRFPSMMGGSFSTGQDVLQFISHIARANVHLLENPDGLGAVVVEQRQGKVLDADKFLVAASGLVLGGVQNAV